MIGYESTWYFVFAGTYVRDVDGTTWRCVEQLPWPTNNGANYALITALGDERQVGVPYDTAVTIMVPTLEEAVATVGAKLGGTVIADA